MEFRIPKQGNDIEEVVNAASEEEAGKIITSRNKEYALLNDVAHFL